MRDEALPAVGECVAKRNVRNDGDTDNDGFERCRYTK